MISGEARVGEHLTRREMLVGTTLVVAAMALESCSSGDEKPGDPVRPHIIMEAQEIKGRTDLLQAGSWGYMAGAKQTADGLDLAPTGLAIVNKREGDRIDPDPPLNVGMRLQASGDFAVAANIRSERPVSLQLYGTPPLRYDDFRYDRSRVEYSTAGNTLNVRIWEGSRQDPAVMQSYQFDGSPVNRQIEVRREGGELVCMVNGRQVARLPKGDMFKTGEVWLGLNSEQGPARVTALDVRPLNGHKLGLVDTTSLRVTEQLPDGLQSLVRKPNFHIGAAAALHPLVSDSPYAQLFLGGEVGSWTTENALKPQAVQPLEGMFTFAEGDALVELARRHGVAIHGHALMYDKAMPRWMRELPHETAADKRRLREVLEAHVFTVASHFKGRIASWDVWNELVKGFNDGVTLAENPFTRGLGEEAIDIAFHAAHRADPAARLYYNDYGLETNPQGRGKFTFDLARRLLARGVPLQGIGVQGHVNEMPRDIIKPGNLRDLMREADDLELEMRVTELDVTGAKGAEAQAKQYADVLRVGLEAPNCTGITFWGLDDLHGAGTSVKGGSLRPGNAAPYTADYRPKQARRAMLDVLRG